MLLGPATLEEYIGCDDGEAVTWGRARDFIWGSRWPEPLVLIDRTDLGAVAAGTDEPLYYVRDGLGSPAALTSADGTVVERYTYDAYGTTYVERPDGQGGWEVADTSAYGNPFLWTGQRYDAGVGQYHFPGRTLWPGWGRWLQRDPLGYVGGVNLYEYVGGDWHWIDRLVWPARQWHDYAANDNLRTFVAYQQGSLAGYYELQQQEGGRVEIRIFGLTPPFVGRGYGGPLLDSAIENAFAWGARRVWVHTCSYDHHNALNNYLKSGFQIFKVEEKPG